MTPNPTADALAVAAALRAMHARGKLAGQEAATDRCIRLYVQWKSSPELVANAAAARARFRAVLEEVR